MFNRKINLIAIVCLFSSLAEAQVNNAEISIPAFGPTTSLEFEQGPTGKIDLNELNSIKDYAFDANTSINRILSQFNQGDDSVEIKKEKIISKINAILQKSKDKRSVLLLTHSLQAGLILVKLIDQQSFGKSQTVAPQGIISQQLRILKQSLVFAQEYYESDYRFIDGVLTTNEIKTNPDFISFGVKLSKFIIQMSNGIVNLKSNYGMVRWSLGVLTNYIKLDRNTGIAHSSTRYNLVTELTSKQADQKSIYPDVVNGEEAPTDMDCITKTRELKFLAQQSFEEIDSTKKSLLK